jgi:hypothetical protein
MMIFEGFKWDSLKYSYDLLYEGFANVTYNIVDGQRINTVCTVSGSEKLLWLSTK